MTPEQRQEFEQMKQDLRKIKEVTDISFIESLSRRLGERDFLTTSSKLSALSDVSGTDSASTGQVLKKTSTTWQPGTDNTT